ncbi:MAG: lipopolysaccharide biosynthesis protein [Candidatus Omnitrophica bacterium]|nr:lipopolysaccharide biosynthesis protein [Candidatus Omnitrophota bacterium]
MNNVYDNNDFEMENTLRDYMKVLFRQKWVVLLCLLTVSVVSAAGLMMKTKQYEAQVKMLISAEKQVESPYYRELIGGRSEVTLTQSEIVKSNPVIERAVLALGMHKLPQDFENNFASWLKRKWINYKTKKFNELVADVDPKRLEEEMFRVAVDSLKKDISVEPIRDTNMFVIKVRFFSPEGAARIANAISRSYVIFDLEQQLAELQLRYGDKHPTVNIIKDNIFLMEQNLGGSLVTNLEAIGPASVKIIEQATRPLRSLGTSKKITFGLAVIMSVFLGIMLAFTFEYLDQSLKQPQDIERYLGVPFLGGIPRKRWMESKVVHDQSNDTGYVRAVQTLTDQTYLLVKEKHLSVLQISPATPADNTTRITMNLGLNLSQKLKNKILLIDADMRHPSLHKESTSRGNYGLVDILTAKKSYSEAIEVMSSSLDILYAGRTHLNPVTLLDSTSMHALIETVKQQYSLVIVNTADLRSNRDAAILAPMSDGIIVAFDEGLSRRQVIKNSLARLNNSQSKILGIILNNRKYPIPKFVYDRI